MVWVLVMGSLRGQDTLRTNPEDDLGLHQALLRGETVDIGLIDEEIQEMVKILLWQGGTFI